MQVGRHFKGNFAVVHPLQTPSSRRHTVRIPWERSIVKRRIIIRICAIAASAVVAANAGAVVAVALSIPHEASLWPAGSYSFWPERSWRTIEARIGSLPASSRLSRSVLGVAHYRQGTLPVHCLRFLPTGRPALKVLIISGVHGTETAGVEAALQIAERMAHRPSTHPDVDMTLVPVANPWAWVYGYRYDGIGEDVNRDFSSARTQEAAVLRDFIDRSGPYDLFMDLHESKKSGYFLYQYLPAKEGLGAEYGKLLSSMGRKREASYREGPFQARDGVLHISPLVLPWISLAHRLSLEQYARLHGTRHAYTVETPVADQLEARVAVHIRTVEAFIGALLAGRQD